MEGEATYSLYGAPKREGLLLRELAPNVLELLACIW